MLISYGAMLDTAQFKQQPIIYSFEELERARGIRVCVYVRESKTKTKRKRWSKLDEKTGLRT